MMDCGLKCEIPGVAIAWRDVETPLGVVHLAGFDQKPKHRPIIFEILSKISGKAITAEDLEESKENPRPFFPKLDFDTNWTHSNNYCVLAFGDRGSYGKLWIGVDLERHSAKRLPLAQRFFSTEEAARIKSLTNGAETGNAEKEFFRLWCRKEAFFKCVGGEFFEGSLRRSMLESPVQLKYTGYPIPVHLVDLNGSDIKAPMASALCVAVSESRL